MVLVNHLTSHVECFKLRAKIQTPHDELCSPTTNITYIPLFDHIDLRKGSKMRLRKVLSFNILLGLTLPKEYSNALNLSKGDYVEVGLQDEKTIVVRKHEYTPVPITTNT